MNTPPIKAATRPSISWIPAVILLAVVFTIYARTIALPYVQDDWLSIHAVTHGSTLEFVSNQFNPTRNFFYRPLVRSYIAVMYKVCGLNTAPHHVLALLTLFGSSLLVASVTRHFLRDRYVAWAGGFLYAGAVGTHMDSVVWAVGGAILAGALLYFLSLWLFLKKRMVLSVLAFVLALFCRDDTILLPVVLGLAILTGAAAGSTGRGWRRWLLLWPYGMVWGCYALLRLRGSPIGTLDESHPYYTSVGTHIFGRLLLYTNWLCQSVLSLYGGFVRSHLTWVTIAVVGLMVCTGLLLRRTQLRTASGRVLVFLLAWLLVGLLPAILLPNLDCRYYLSYSLAPALMLFLATLKDLAQWLTKSEAVSRVLLVLATGIILLSGGRFFAGEARKGINQPYMRGTNMLFRRCATVDLVRDTLFRYVPRLPKNAVLVLDGVELTSIKHYVAPQVWYDDPTICVFSLNAVQRGRRGFYAEGRGKSAILKLDRTFVFRRKGREMVPVYLPADSTPAMEPTYRPSAR